jgi:hypothetical protein
MVLQTVNRIGTNDRSIAHFLLDVKEEKNNYVCAVCSQDWWIEGERQSRSRRFIFSILAYLDSDDPGKAFVERQSYHLGSYVRAFGRSETLIGAFFGATIILLISFQERLAYSVLFMALVIIAPLSGVLFWIVRRLDFLLTRTYGVRSRIVIGGVLGGLIAYLLLSLF